MSNYLIESSRGIQSVSLNDQFLTDRKIFIEGEITDTMANDIVRQLMYLEMSESYLETKIFINSPGGSVGAGLLIYDFIRSMSSPVTIICTSLAASMASIIYLAAEKEKRFMMEHSQIMIHDPCYAYCDMSHKKPHEIKETLEDLEKNKQLLVDIISERTGQTRERVYEIMKKDTFFNVEEAVDFGLSAGLAKPAMIFINEYDYDKYNFDKEEDI